MARTPLIAFCAAAVTAAALFPAEASGQRSPRAEFPEAHLTFELFAGLANYGRFLEEYPIDFDDDLSLLGQREVSADNALAIGASFGVRVWEKTGVRLGFTFSPTELKFEDDSGIDSDFLDEDDLADLNVFVLSLEIIQFLLDPNRRWSPYASAGITANWWNLGDDGSGEIVAVDETQFRWGGMGALGVQYRANRNLGVRLEVATMALGNPFDGNSSYRTTTGIAFDEPGHVRLSRITLALTYSTLKDRRRR